MTHGENFKTRTFCGVWYPEEDMTHLFALNTLEKNGFSFFAIDHDRDTHDDGTIKKKHTHVYIRVKGPRWSHPLAKELGIEPNYLEPCRDTNATFRYFLHDGYPEKAQYDLESGYGTLVPEVRKLIINGDESSRVLQILDLLDSMSKPCTYRKFLVAVCENGMYGDFRRMGSGIKTLLDEHNGLLNLYDV